MYKKILIEISLMNQKPDVGLVTNEFKKDLIEVLEKHFGKDWNNVSYKEE